MKRITFVGIIAVVGILGLVTSTDTKVSTATRHPY